MNIEANEFKIEMTHNELWSTAFDVRNSLIASLKDHWVNHQNAWETNENERLYRLKTFFAHLGRLDLYEDVFTVANDIFKKWNDKKATN